jgi:glycosyltransferase involved in cell wall biosynthesis/2-polyprenyl-3-methyl-5-hydroxy-6-metoxy-1,4-benzoquinol methylase
MPGGVSEYHKPTMNPAQIPQPPKYKIAVWTPLPPLKTGIADYIAELLPFLNRDFDLEIFVDDSYVVDAGIAKTYKVFSFREYGERAKTAEFDLNIYEMGNNHHHIYIYEQAIRTPGLAVLHDLSLSFMLYHHYAGLNNDITTFRNEFLFSEGAEALAQFDRIYSTGDNEAIMELFSRHHMLRRLMGRSYAVLSHLEYSTEVAREKYGAQYAYTMYLGSPDPTLELPGVSKEEARRQLGVSSEQFVIGVFGHLQPNKQNEVMLRALAKIKSKYSHAFVTFVGKLNNAMNYDHFITDLVQKLDLTGNVRFTGFVNREDMQKYYLASDVVVNLRYPSFGQMSATLSRGIATGRPAIITDLPEWRFFPESFCWRVPAKDEEGSMLADLVIRLIENPRELDERGKAAREFYLAAGTTQRAADNMRRIILEVLEKNPKDVSLDLEPIHLRSRAEITTAAFEEWDRLRAGGNKRYLFEKIRRIPLLGPPVFVGLVLLANVYYAREIRRAEWVLRKTLVDGVASVDLRNTAIHEDVVEFGVKIKSLTEETRNEYEPDPIRILNNPLGEIAGYRPRRPKSGVDQDSDESFYISLEQAFRGSAETILQRQKQVLNEIRSYVQLEKDVPVLDVGCGRGEFLSLLRNEGVNPIGVDANQILIQHLREKGYEAHASDIFDYLESIPNDTIKGITAFHVIEHFTHDQSMKFLALAYRKLAAGGFIYLETPNPLCSDSLSRFYTDPTHQRPIQPFQLSFLLEYNYFDNLRVIFQQPVRTRGSLSNERWITLYQDYGILASKPLEKTG